MNIDPAYTDLPQGLEHDPERARRMAQAEAPEREAILRAKAKRYPDRMQLSKEILRREAWADDASALAGANYDHDQSPGERLVGDSREAEIMAHAARPAMEKYRRGKKLRRAVDVVIDQVITRGGFEGMPRTTAYLHHVARRYFKRKERDHLARADIDAEAARDDL